MEDIEIRQRLREITDGEWEIAFKKAYSHVELRVCGRTLSGAHSQQRLGMSPADFYVGNAIKALYDGSWRWQYERFSLIEQLVRIIDSMISEQVRKYTSESKRGIKIPVLIQPILFLGADFDGISEDDITDQNEVFLNSLRMACEGNDLQSRFVDLRLNGSSYIEISDELKISVNEAYRMMETIARKAKRIVKAENEK